MRDWRASVGRLAIPAVWVRGECCVMLCGKPGWLPSHDEVTVVRGKDAMGAAMCKAWRLEAQWMQSQTEWETLQ